MRTAVKNINSWWKKVLTGKPHIQQEAEVGRQGHTGTHRDIQLTADPESHGASLWKIHCPAVNHPSGLNTSYQ